MNKVYINSKGNATLVMVMIPTGSYYEEERVKGISHFVEHMMFKGTHSRSRTDIQNAIEGVGGDLNAFTDTEMTCYWAKVANKYKDIAIEVITDLALNPTFPIKEINKEREVIVQELKMYKDSPSASVNDLYNSIYYPKESGMHTSIIGTEESLSRIDRKELIRYYENTYKNPTLIIVGDVKNKTEGQIEIGSHIDNTIYHPKTRKPYLETRKIEQAHIIMGNDVYLPQYSKIDKELLLDILDLVYGGMSGRLFETIREKNNLVYGIHFNSTLWSGDTLTWCVNLGLEKSKITKARKLIEQELVKKVSPKELEETIIKAVGVHALETESLNHTAQTIAYSLRHGTDWRPFYHEYEENLRRVSKYVNKFIKELNFKENLMVGIVPK